MTDAEKEYRKVHLQYRIALLAAVIALGMGSIVYHVIEKLSWIDAFYFSTTTLTTVGYGDIAPHTNVGKIFTIFYIIAGIGILASLANLMIKHAVLKRKNKRKL